MRAGGQWSAAKKLMSSWRSRDSQSGVSPPTRYYRSLPPKTQDTLHSLPTSSPTATWDLMLSKTSRSSSTPLHNLKVPSYMTRRVESTKMRRQPAHTFLVNRQILNMSTWKHTSLRVGLDSRSTRQTARSRLTSGSPPFL